MQAYSEGLRLTERNTDGKIQAMNATVEVWIVQLVLAVPQIRGIIIASCQEIPFGLKFNE